MIEGLLIVGFLVALAIIVPIQDAITERYRARVWRESYTSALRQAKTGNGYALSYERGKLPGARK